LEVADVVVSVAEEVEVGVEVEVEVQAAAAEGGKERTRAAEDRTPGAAERGQADKQEAGQVEEVEGAD